MENKKRNTLKVVKSGYDKRPSNAEAMAMFIFMLTTSCSGCMLISMIVLNGLEIEMLPYDALLAVIKLPLYWIVAVITAIMFFVSWLGDKFHSKS